MIASAHATNPDVDAGAWAPLQEFVPSILAELPMSAILTHAQFPGLHLESWAQEEAMDALSEFFDAVEEDGVEGGIMLAFPGVEGSSIPGDGMDVGVRTALERLENYRRFGAAAAASVVSPEQEWPEPFSRDLPQDRRAREVWASLEQLAVVALSARDDQRIRTDVDPTEAVLSEGTCVDMALLSPRSTLDASIPGDHEDRSWNLTHAAQEFAYGKLIEGLRDPEATAPVSRVVATLGPRCPWGNKRGYGFCMVTTWYDVRRLERIAADMLEGEDQP